jgi:hypothetical protein
MRLPTAPSENAELAPETTRAAEAPFLLRSQTFYAGLAAAWLAAAHLAPNTHSSRVPEIPPRNERELFILPARIEELKAPKARIV